MADNKVLNSIPVGHKLTSFIEKALADGAILQESPWGNRPGDRSVRLQKTAPDLKGHFNIWVVDRDLVSPVTYQVSNEVNIVVWFVDPQPEGCSDKEYSLNYDDNEYNYSKLVAAANSCLVCGKKVGFENLSHVAFANSACSECLTETVNQLERPGWDK